jgi:hypothetical protein
MHDAAYPNAVQLVQLNSRMTRLKHWLDANIMGWENPTSARQRMLPQYALRIGNSSTKTANDRCYFACLMRPVLTAIRLTIALCRLQSRAHHLRFPWVPIAMRAITSLRVTYIQPHPNWGYEHVSR